MQFSKVNLRLGESGPAMGMSISIAVTPTEVKALTTFVEQNARLGFSLNDNQLTASVSAGTIGHVVKQIQGNLNKFIPDGDTNESLIKFKTDMIALTNRLNEFEKSHPLSLGSSGKEKDYKGRTNTELNNFNNKFTKEENKNSFGLAKQAYIDGINSYKQGKLDDARAAFELFQQKVEGMGPKDQESLKKAVEKEMGSTRHDKESLSSTAENLITNIDALMEAKAQQSQKLSSENVTHIQYGPGSRG